MASSRLSGDWAPGSFSPLQPCPSSSHKVGHISSQSQVLFHIGMQCHKYLEYWDRSFYTVKSCHVLSWSEWSNVIMSFFYTVCPMLPLPQYKASYLKCVRKKSYRGLDLMAMSPFAIQWRGHMFMLVENCIRYTWDKANWLGQRTRRIFAARTLTGVYGVCRDASVTLASDLLHKYPAT